MAEVERVKKADAAAATMAAIRARIDSLVREDIIPPISAIDRGEFDDYILTNGEWVRRTQSSNGGQGNGL
jgi:hypothetical protein